jgi:hypothetical protein
MLKKRGVTYKKIKPWYRDDPFSSKQAVNEFVRHLTTVKAGRKKERIELYRDATGVTIKMFTSLAPRNTISLSDEGVQSICIALQNYLRRKVEKKLKRKSKGKVL